MNTSRIVDANFNRAAEGLRVLEEISRFILDDFELTEKLKIARHQICKLQDNNYSDLLCSRDSVSDVGLKVENPSSKNGVLDVFRANIKRVQQALRVLQEYGKDTSEIESLRYLSYEIEKDLWNNLVGYDKQKRLDSCKLYLVTNSDMFENETVFFNVIESAIEGGVDIVQLREKNAQACEIVEKSLKLRKLTKEKGVLFIVNDRVDIAKIVDADGVHLGQSDISLDDARKVLSPEKIIGISTHTIEDAKKAMFQKADYIGVGPVFETPTKPGRKSCSLEYLQWAVENVAIPFFAIVGINLDNLDIIKSLKAKRVAVVRAIMNAKNAKEAALSFKENLL